MSGRKNPQSVDSKVLIRIYGMGVGSVFTSARFLDLGSRVAVDLALSRLAKKGTIRRLSRGLYDYPKSHPTLGALFPPVDAIAKALLNPSKGKLQPSGAYAANLLGLSEQVPLKSVFLTTGTPRRVRVQRQEIILKRTTPRQMATAGRVSGLVIQALKYLGPSAKVDDRLLALKHRLGREEKMQLQTDAPLAPGWIAKKLREIAAE
jgi:hypothetical protein